MVHTLSSLHTWDKVTLVDHDNKITFSSIGEEQHILIQLDYKAHDHIKIIS